MVSHKTLFQNDKDQTISQEVVNDLLGPPGAYSIREVKRRGKFLLFDLTDNVMILSHLGFTGWWIPEWAPEQSPRRFLHPMDINRHTRVTIQTQRGPLFLTDPRCLSRHRVFKDGQSVFASRHLVNMGPDADTVEGQERIKDAMSKTGRRIRDLIMDQQVASGVGNYLACEALHRARLHGAERANSLNEDQVILLLHSIKECIHLAETQDDTNWWCVFQRKKTPDGHPVTREDWGTRGHYLSYYHQPKPKHLKK